MNYGSAFVRLPLVREPGTARVTTPEDVARECGDLAGLAQESFHVLCLDSKNRLVNRHLVSLGLADASLVHPREVFRPAVSDGASAVVLVHNHPSGDPSPSSEDLRITRQLVAAGKVMGIPALDHVVVGRRAGGEPACVSMREAGFCKFD
ncbi:RadC family protein [Verrucomicrobiota bacterium]